VAHKPDVQWDLPEMIDALEQGLIQDKESETFFPAVHVRLLRYVAAILNMDHLLEEASSRASERG
jgi:hypothetical protein